MSIPIIAFFNNKGGVGKTSLVYHLAWMYRALGLRVIAADLDPQANLTAAFLSEEKLEELWMLKQPNTIFRCVEPLLRGIGDIRAPQLEPIAPKLSLLVGDLLLSGFEDNLAAEWPGCMDRKELSFRVISAFWRVLQQAIQAHRANVVLLDLGPNLGAINRTALIAADFVVVPLSPDLFSLQGLRNLGPTLKRWRQEWTERVAKNPVTELALPKGQMQPVGYTLLQYWNYNAATERPAKAYQRWIDQIPNTYRHTMMGKSNETVTVTQDPYCLATIKHYKSLMPLAQAVHKPIFQLQASDGALGASIQVAHTAYQDFEALARNIARNCKSYRQKAATLQSTG